MTVARGLLAGAALMLATSVAPLPADPGAIVIDAGADRHAISPLIYGVAFADSATLRDLNAPLNRSGGNSASQYNWRDDARAAGRDWYHETLPCTPDDGACFNGDRFVAATHAGGAAAMMTVPIGGWVARVGAGRTRRAAFSVARYGAQRATDPGFPDAGDGVRADGREITGNDPTDAAQRDTPADQQAWVRHLAAGPAQPRYYALDNEPSLWFLIHRATHPVGAHAREIAARTIRYAAAIKAADPAAQVVAPEEWGWNGYRYSGYDQQWGNTHGLADAPDRRTQTGGMDYVPWLLTQWKRAGRPVDVFSLHYYPQGGEYRDAGADVSPAMQRRRNRSTRSLWDPNYVDETWIAEPVALIPRMRGWVARYYYPGTPLAITEYSWGADAHMNGATAQADVLGIFGRERLSIATRWIAPKPGTPVYLAMKLFRNADGRRGGFGETGVAARAPAPDTLSAFAALRRDGALTIVAINKAPDRAIVIDAAIAGFAPAGTVEGYRVALGRLGAIATGRYAGGRLRATLPAQSITLFVLRG